MVTLDYISQLPKNIREEIHACMTQRSLESGDSIYQQNEESDALYQVISGEIRIFNVSREGREVLYVTYHKGDTFGEIGVLDQGVRPHNAVANGPTVLSVLQKKDFNDLRQQHPEINEQLILMLCQRLRLVFGFFEGSALLPLPSRLAQRLVNLRIEQEKKHQKNDNTEIHLSQSDLANMMGASRQAISKVLKSWEDQKLIKLDYGKTTILNLKQIRKIASEL